MLIILDHIRFFFPTQFLYLPSGYDVTQKKYIIKIFCDQGKTSQLKFEHEEAYEHAIEELDFACMNNHKKLTLSSKDI